MNGAGNKSEAREPLAGAVFHVLLGPIVWAVHLTLVYGGHTLLCVKSVASGALAAGAVSLGVVIVTAAALIVLIVAVVAAHFRGRALENRGPATMFFRDRVMMILALLSGVGVAWEGASALIVGPCLMLR